MGCGQQSVFHYANGAAYCQGYGCMGGRFDVEHSPDQKLLAIDGALGMPGFQLQPGQTYNARFEIYAGPEALSPASPTSAQ